MSSSPVLDDPEHAPASPVVAPTKPRLLNVLGPGLITGASDDDPSGIATYSQAGAQFGYALGWTMLLTYPLMVAVQMISARVGRTTGLGLAGIMRRHTPAWLLHAVVLLLLLANTINIGADLGAMGAACHLVIGAPAEWLVVGFGVVCVLMQVFLQYTLYVSYLKWLTLALFAYVATVFMSHVDWGAAVAGLFIPRLGFDRTDLATIVAVLGTTISPYLFFWQASQEAEDVRTFPRRRILIRAPQQAASALARIEVDTLVGMGFSNVIALSILWTAAATLHVRGVTDIQTSVQAAEALRPIAGAYASVVFAVGIVSTGLLSIPVFAGSSAYAIGEARHWPTGLSRQPAEARLFYGTIAAATLAGIGLNFVAIDPVRALFWAAVINGVVAVPVMAVLMVLSGREAVMGAFAVRGWLKILGWAATATMGACVAAMGLAAIL